MERQVIYSETLKEEMYCYHHKSGLSILLYPMNGYQSVYAMFGTNYGSIDTTFKTQKDSDFVTVPEGIAHFLEHKLFESEDGDALMKFAKTGASANAYTSFEKTCYLFLTTSHFEESLKLLISFVQDPYFTEQTIQKEQGIIGQEIKMYEDDPNWRVFFNLLEAMYWNNPVRIDIAGTTDSIQKIDKELLYRCYHTFYNLNNMVVAIAGNFDEQQAAKIIEENLKDCEKIEVETKIPEEPENVREKCHVQKLSVAIPLFQIGFKEKPQKIETEYALQIQYELILEAIAGKGSSLYKTMYEQGLINETFEHEVFYGRGFLANFFSGESRDPEKVRDMILAEIRRLKENGIDQDTFDRLKKSLYGDAVQTFNDVEELANEMVTACFSHHGIYDSLELISGMTLENVNACLRTSLLENACALSVVMPKE